MTMLLHFQCKSVCVEWITLGHAINSVTGFNLQSFLMEL